jgi:hypothetical protein
MKYFLGIQDQCRPIKHLKKHTMTKKRDYLILTLLLLFSLPVFSQEKPKESDKRMEGFKDAKLGIFVTMASMP